MLAVRRWVAVIPFLMLGLVVMTGCEGEQGPAGPQGPPGEVDTPYTYMGKNGEACSHCHSNTVASVMLTNHTMAYDDLVGDKQNADNPYCLQCHTVGWDSPINYGDTEITTYGPDTEGYDDYWGVAGDEAAERRADLEGVQCESCHGPMGPAFTENHALLSFNDGMVDEESQSLCFKCHHTQIDEWSESGHGMMSARGGSCAACHSAEGFIKANDPAFATYNFSGSSPVGCVTCHDPHAGDLGSGNVHQLRQVGAVEVSYDPDWEPGEDERPKMEGYGPAQTCAQCHHARRDDDNVAGQIAEGYGHFGPHHSAQMDMFIGAGCYEIEGMTYDTTHTHQSIEHACVDCHMVRETLLHGELQDHSFHTFTPEVGSCTGCHTGWVDFSEVTTFQATITAKMDELAVLFGYADWVEMEDTWDSEAMGVEVWQREAAYAAFFVYDDASHGAHNPDYAMDLLQNAIDHYTAMDSK
ncbi:ammonia-forming cytochrome c nitrite reductase subunit c552 [bacterium]|nr:ammonia-forming cytochrome c nitrite reductase subunit c552 [bacterium]